MGVLESIPLSRSRPGCLRVWQRIYESINNTSFSRKALFKEKYNQLKYKLGHIPSLYDFAVNGEFNPELILNHKDYLTYHDFLYDIEELRHRARRS